MDVIGAYDLYLYCDKENDNHTFNEFPHIFNEESYELSVSLARKRGWIVNRDKDYAVCPKCSGKNKGSNIKLRGE
jgi:hypothetical protein